MEDKVGKIFKSEIFKTVMRYLLIIVCVILIRIFFIDPVRVDGGSMDTTLANGQIITAKQYIEQYVLTINKLRVEKPPYKIITETMKLDDPWKIHNENFKRLDIFVYHRQSINQSIKHLSLW